MTTRACLQSPECEESGDEIEESGFVYVGFGFDDYIYFAACFLVETTRSERYAHRVSSNGTRSGFQNKAWAQAALGIVG
jgi:hypothetical protein